MGFSPIAAGAAANKYMENVSTLEQMRLDKAREARELEVHDLKQQSSQLALDKQNIQSALEGIWLGSPESMQKAAEVLGWQSLEVIRKDDPEGREPGVRFVDANGARRSMSLQEFAERASRYGVDIRTAREAFFQKHGEYPDERRTRLSAETKDAADLKKAQMDLAKSKQDFMKTQQDIATKAAKTDVELEATRLKNLNLATQLGLKRLEGIKPGSIEEQIALQEITDARNKAEGAQAVTQKRLEVLGAEEDEDEIEKWDALYGEDKFGMPTGVYRDQIDVEAIMRARQAGMSADDATSYMQSLYKYLGKVSPKKLEQVGKIKGLFFSGMGRGVALQDTQTHLDNLLKPPYKSGGGAEGSW